MLFCNSYIIMTNIVITMYIYCTYIVTTKIPTSYLILTYSCFFDIIKLLLIGKKYTYIKL